MGKRLICLIATAVTVIGAVLMAVGYVASGKNLDNMSMSKIKTETYEPGEDFDDITIKAGSADVTLMLSEDGKCKIDVKDFEGVAYTVKVEDGILSVNSKDDRSWYKKTFNFGFGTNRQYIKVYLPEKVYKSVKLSSSSGDIKVEKEIAAESISVSASSGDVSQYGSADEVTISASSGDVKADGTAKKISVDTSSGDIIYTCEADEVTVKASSGDITVKGSANTSLDVKTSSGDIAVHDIVCSGLLKMKSTSGDIDFYSCDAGELQIEASSGDVDGSLLSENIFSTSSKSGDIKVPKSSGGEICDVTTSSGDIEITIK